MFKRRNKSVTKNTARVNASGKNKNKSKRANSKSDTALLADSVDQTSMLSDRKKTGAIPDNLSTSSAQVSNPRVGIQQHMAPVLQSITAEKEQLFTSIVNGNWGFVRKRLKSRMGKKVCLWKDSSNLSLLGMILGSRAPIDIVEIVLKLNPDAVLDKDVFGAMPLHLGCLNGISPEVVQMIFDLDSGHSARVPDKDSRTALHHAVEYGCLLPKKEDSSLLSIVCEQSIETIELILSVAPATVHCMTLKGDTPLDIPQIIKLKRNDVNTEHIDEIYRILKATSIEVYQRQKQLWEANGYAPTRGKQDKVENNSVPSLLSSQASSTATNSKAVLYEELDKMSSHSAGQLST